MQIISKLGTRTWEHEVDLFKSERSVPKYENAAFL